MCTKYIPGFFSGVLLWIVSSQALSKSQICTKIVFGQVPATDWWQVDNIPDFRTMSDFKLSRNLLLSSKIPKSDR